MSSNELKSKISEVSSKLGNGRLLVRASGTEPVVRVTAESLFKPDCVWAVAEIEKVVLSLNTTN
jgi:phosphomannomutase